MTDRPMTYEELAAVMRELRESGHLTSMPPTGFGMPDLDVLRGRGAIPGKPLQAMSGPAPLPPWADVARSFTPIGGVDEAARNLAEAEHAGDYGRGAAAVGQGVASALPVVGRMGRVSGAAYGGLVGAFPALAAGPAEAQQAPAPIDDGLTADQRGRRALLLKQQQKEGLPRALRTELEGINRISEQYAAGKNAATIEAERKRKENELAIQREQGEQALAERTRQVQQAEAARDKALGEVRPDFETRFSCSIQSRLALEPLPAQSWAAKAPMLIAKP